MLSAELPVHSTPGTLPAFWDRQVVFVANLLAMFFGNEAGTRALAEEIGEADSYGGRLLPILNLLYRGGGNLLVLERAPDVALMSYFSDRLGLSLPDVEVLSHDEYLKIAGQSTLDHPLIGHLKAHAAPWMDGYVTDETLDRLASRLGKTTISSNAGSRLGNNKRLLYQDMAAAGMAIPPTFHAAVPEDAIAALEELCGQGYQTAVVKSAIGASGIGLNKIRSLNQADLIAAARGLPPYFFYEGPCLVQGWLEPGVHGVIGIRSPSVQIFVSDDEAMLYDITEQILSHHSVHEGNESPPPYLQERPTWKDELLEKGAWAARWLHRQGYRGTASADFLIVQYDDNRVEIQICELNARVTGATYPAVLARHFLPEGCWLLRNLRFERPISGSALLGALADSGDLHAGGAFRSSAGILPINFNFGNDGLVHKGQFLCLASDSDGCHRLLQRACRLLPCATERD